MIPEQASRIITEKMGKCWHEWEPSEDEGFPICKKCFCRRYHVFDPTQINDDQQWDWFGKVWNWAKEQEWWDDLLHEFWISGPHKTWLDRAINPTTFAITLAEWLEERKKETDG